MKDAYDFAHAPRGPVIPATGKTRISIYLDDDVIGAFRDQAGTHGKGYQTLINDALRAALAPESRPATQAQMAALIQCVQAAVASSKKPVAKPSATRKTSAHWP